MSNISNISNTSNMSNNYLIPIHISKYYIYDIFYNNGVYHIIGASEIPPLNITLIDSSVTTKFTFINDPHKHTSIYLCNYEYHSQIKLSINNDIIYTAVNRYKSFENEILMTTIVKNEDKYIRQWIIYHLNLGITRFIIYDNSEFNTLGSLLDDFVKNETVILFKWTYEYLMNISGISGQTTQQNHSIYVYNDAKYIGMFDIDEYVNPQLTYTNIDVFFNEIITKEHIDVKTFGSFRLLSKNFYNPNNLSIDGYDFLKMYNCGKDVIYHGHEKNFVIPKNVLVYSVHMITLGKPMYTISPKLLYFNHYIYLNKTDRGRDITEFTDDSIVNKLTFIS